MRKCVSVSVADYLPDSSSTFLNFSLTRTANLSPRIELGSEEEGWLCSKIIFFQPLNTSLNVLLVSVSVGYSPATYTTSENEGIVELTVAILDPPSRAAPRPFTLVTRTEDGTASRFLLF